MSVEYDYLLKILLVGDSGVGKSALLQKYVDNTFPDSYISTIGVDFKIKEQIYGSKKYKLQIWDTAGQERFRSITSSYYRGANCILIMFDLTDPESFDHVKMWLEDADKYGNANVMKILIGTKADLITKIAIDKNVINNFVDSVQIEYIETSAKNGNNINALFEKVCSNFLAKFSNVLPSNKQNIKLPLKQNVAPDKKCCK